MKKIPHRNHQELGIEAKRTVVPQNHVKIKVKQGNNKSSFSLIFVNKERALNFAESLKLEIQEVD